VKLGDRMKDKVTGFEGIVTTTTRHITGCDGACLVSEDITHAGKEVERYFDVLRLELVAEGVVNIPRPRDVPPSG